MKQQVYIVHGYTASPESNWFPWLRKELENHGITTTILSMPDSHNPHYENWLGHLQSRIELNEETILVGHSLGCVTILGYLNRLFPKPRIKGVVLVSGFIEKVSTLPELDEFSSPPQDFEHLIPYIQNRIAIYSLNDQIVPFYYSENLNQKLKTEYYAIENGGHFLDRDGFEQFPLIYEKILEIIKN